MPKKKKGTVRDRYYPVDQPKNNYDFVEILVGDMDSLERYIYESPQVQQVMGSSYQGDVTPLSKELIQKKQKRLLKKVMQAASQVLTDRQMQVFLLRFVFGLTQEEIADRLTREHVGRPRLDKKMKSSMLPKKISQPYIVQTLTVVVAKIRKALRLEVHSKATI